MESRVIVDSFFKENSLVKHHMDSYNNFIENGIQKVIDEAEVIETEVKGGYKVKFGKVRVGKPKNKEADGSDKEITPMEAAKIQEYFLNGAKLTKKPQEKKEEVKKEEVKVEKPQRRRRSRGSFNDLVKKTQKGIEVVKKAEPKPEVEAKKKEEAKRKLKHQNLNLNKNLNRNNRKKEKKKSFKLMLTWLKWM